MSNTNEMQVEFDGIGENEGFARVVVAAFVSQLNPTLEELGDIKVAVSEAVTNAIIHGYEKTRGKVRIHAKLQENRLIIQIMDSGKGIDDVEKAMEPLFTTKPEEERSGMGEGTTVTMVKVMGAGNGSDDRID